MCHVSGQHGARLDEDNFIYKASFQFKYQTDSNASPPMGYTKTGTSTINGVSYDIYTLSANAQDFATKKLRGTDSAEGLYALLTESPTSCAA